jgi:hypothetical protein
MSALTIENMTWDEKLRAMEDAHQRVSAAIARDLFGFRLTDGC